MHAFILSGKPLRSLFLTFHPQVQYCNVFVDFHKASDISLPTGREANNLLPFYLVIRY